MGCQVRMLFYSRLSGLGRHCTYGSPVWLAGQKQKASLLYGLQVALVAQGLLVRQGLAHNVRMQALFSEQSVLTSHRRGGRGTTGEHALMLVSRYKQQIHLVNIL